MAGESPVAFAANVAANAGVDLHVLLQRRLGLETFSTEQAEDGHVRACGDRNTTRNQWRYFQSWCHTFLLQHFLSIVKQLDLQQV